MSKKTNSDHEKGNLQLITFDRNTIHSESFGLIWTIFFEKKKVTGSMTSPFGAVRLEEPISQIEENVRAYTDT